VGVCMYVCMCVSTYIHMYSYIPLVREYLEHPVLSSVCVSDFVCECVCVCMHVCIYKYTYVHVYTNCSQISSTSCLANCVCEFLSV